jgi:predicted enzyme related to lactoylglutathione lyase
MSQRNISHVEIPSRNVEESGQFYHELFGWKITPLPELNYCVWEAAGGSRGGFTALKGELKTGDVQIYVDSDDVDADLHRAQALGATIVQPATQIPSGWFGLFKDPTGNTIGLFKRPVRP